MKDIFNKFKIKNTIIVQLHKCETKRGKIQYNDIAFGKAEVGEL